MPKIYHSVGLEGNLVGKSRNLYIGKEKELETSDENIRCFASLDGFDYRFIYVINNKNVSVLHIDKLNGVYTIRNAYTLENYRRQGLGIKLYKEATKQLGRLEFSSNLSDDGKAFKSAVYADGGLLYHGSNKKFDKFTTNKIESGQGANDYGWGIYLTEEEKVALFYANDTKKRTKAIYSVVLKDGLTWLEWDVALSDKLFDMIEQQAKLQNNIMLEMLTKPFNRNGMTGEYVYDNITKIFGSKKEASLFLLKAGFAGIKYPIDFKSKDKKIGKYNYVVFDENYIRIKKVDFLENGGNVSKLNSSEVLNVIKKSGINTEYEPRFAAYYGDDIVGGSTYQYVAGTYSFDIGVLDAYQGKGVGKMIMQHIKEDAEQMGAERLYTLVVNENFKTYLQRIGFNVNEDYAEMYLSEFAEGGKVELETFDEGGKIDTSIYNNPTVTFDDFHLSTFANFKKISRKEVPNREADFKSRSGSKYWYEADFVIRQSNHWGRTIASCNWLLESKAYQGESQGKCSLKDFHRERTQLLWNDDAVGKEFKVCKTSLIRNGGGRMDIEIMKGKFKKKTFDYYIFETFKVGVQTLAYVEPLEEILENGGEVKSKYIREIDKKYIVESEKEYEGLEHDKEFLKEYRKNEKSFKLNDCGCNHTMEQGREMNSAAQIKEIFKKAQIPFSDNLSYKNGSHYFRIDGVSYRVSDHAKPKGTTSAYEEGLNDFRSYQELYYDLSQNFDLSDKTNAESDYKEKASKFIVKTDFYGEEVYKQPDGTMFGTMEGALNNMWMLKKQIPETFSKGGEIFLAPNGKPSNLNTEQYDLVRTPEFFSWFGRWDILAEAKNLSGDIKGIYKNVALDNIEMFLFEISQQCNSRESEKKGALKAVGKRIVELALELFPDAKVGDKFIRKVSKIVDDNGEPLVARHTTQKNIAIEVFKEKKVKHKWSVSKKGMYFSSVGKDDINRIYNRTGDGYVIEVFLNIKNVLDLGRFDSYDFNENKPIQYYDILKRNLYNVEAIKESDYFPIETITSLQKKKILELGYDGVWGKRDKDYVMVDEIVVFNSNQIKIANGSNTTFDASNPDIRFKNGGLIAPNGKPTNLTPEQWNLVRTAEFKKWSNNWKDVVKDENEEPQVLYSGSPNLFTEFDREFIGMNATMEGRGFYFTSNKKIAEGYAENGYLYEVFVNVGKNISYEKKTLTKKQIRDIITNLEDKGIDVLSNWGDVSYEGRNKVLNEAVNAYFEYGNDVDIINGMFNDIGQDYALYDELVEMGYRGTEIKNANWGENQKIVVSFSPKDIKLATGENITFDASNPDIRFKQGGKLSKTLAPKSDKIYGSDVNDEGSSKDTKSAKEIKFDAKTLLSINNKVKEHNKLYPEKKITLASAKAVIRRGMGAYSSTHRPTISGGKPNSRVAWGLARLNAFMYKIVHGKSKSGNYMQDDDLINELGYKVKKYEDGGTIELLAPNGKPSNLTPEQYKLVRSTSFKKFFGDWERLAKAKINDSGIDEVTLENLSKGVSKVVDSNGEPLVVYHSTNKEFCIFDRSKLGRKDIAANNYGFHFAKDENNSKMYGTRTLQCFLNLKKVINIEYKQFVLNALYYAIDNGNFLSSKIKAKNYIKKIENKQDVNQETITNAYAKNVHFDYKNVFDEYYKYLVLSGITGIIYKRSGKDFYVAFNPEQIKLADGSNTQFDPNNADIRYEKGGSIGLPTNMGTVEEEYGDQYKINGQWYHKSIVKFDENYTELENTYNGLTIPKEVDPNMVMSAFANVIDNEKVEIYTIIMSEEMLGHNFPAATGYPYVIEDSDVGDYFVNGNEINEEHIGMQVWKVWDGHHRMIGASNAKLPYFPVELEYNAITEFEYGGNIGTKLYDKILLRGNKTEVEQIYDLESFNGMGEAGRGVYFFKPSSGMQKYYTSHNEYLVKAKIKNGYEVIDLDAEKETVVRWLNANEYKCNISNYHKQAWGIMEYMKSKYPNAIGYSLQHKGVGIPSGIQVVISNLEGIELLTKNKGSNSYIKNDLVCGKCDNIFNIDASKQDVNYICPKCQFDNETAYIMGKLKTPKTVKEISALHNIPQSEIEFQLQKGVQAEMEHTTDEKIARIIALHHLEEKPNYYDLLKSMESGKNTKNEYSYFEVRHNPSNGEPYTTFEKQGVWQTKPHNSKEISKEDYEYHNKMRTTEDEFAEGGVVVGKRHSEADENGTGERFLVKSTGQVVEVEGGEGVLCPQSMQSNRLFTFEGKKMTGREIASHLNHKYGGVEFAKGGEVGHVCGCKQYYHGGELPSATLEELEGGEAVVTVKSMESKDFYEFNGTKMTPRKIFSQINAASGGKKFEDGGIIDLSKYKLEAVNQLTKMVYFTEKLLHLK